MPRWNLESLTNRQGITYAESNLITWFYSQFDNNAAGSGLNRHIANVEPLYFQGAIAGTELLVYAATKLYLCFDVHFSYLQNAGANALGITFYNEGNNAVGYLYDNEFEIDGVTLLWTGVTIKTKNCYFSRVVSGYTHIWFNGFRITLD